MNTEADAESPGAGSLGDEKGADGLCIPCELASVSWRDIWKTK